MDPINKIPSNLPIEPEAEASAPPPEAAPRGAAQLPDMIVAGQSAEAGILKDLHTIPSQAQEGAHLGAKLGPEARMGISDRGPDWMNSPKHEAGERILTAQQLGSKLGPEAFMGVSDRGPDWVNSPKHDASEQVINPQKTQNE